MIKKRIVWEQALTSGKGSKHLWKTINKATSKKDLNYAVFTLALKVQELEGRLNELKKFVGEERND